MQVSERKGVVASSAERERRGDSGAPSGGGHGLRGQSYDQQLETLRPPGSCSAGGGPVQARGGDVDAEGQDVHAAAAKGIAGGGGPMPHLDKIQRSFGRHDVSGVQAHTGPQAQAAAHRIGAEAYATGNHVAFGGAPSLHTAAHEAAHVVQQRGGVSLKGSVGASGDRYERHADEVADAVVAGESAEPILDRMAGGGAGAVQRKRGPVQRRDGSGGDQDALTNLVHQQQSFSLQGKIAKGTIWGLLKAGALRRGAFTEVFCNFDAEAKKVLGGVDAGIAAGLRFGVQMSDMGAVVLYLDAEVAARVGLSAGIISGSVGVKYGYGVAMRGTHDTAAQMIMSYLKWLSDKCESVIGKRPFTTEDTKAPKNYTSVTSHKLAGEAKGKLGTDALNGQVGGEVSTTGQTYKEYKGGKHVATYRGRRTEKKWSASLNGQIPFRGKKIQATGRRTSAYQHVVGDPNLYNNGDYHRLTWSAEAMIPKTGDSSALAAGLLDLAFAGAMLPVGVAGLTKKPRLQVAKKIAETFKMLGKGKHTTSASIGASIGGEWVSIWEDGEWRLQVKRYFVTPKASLGIKAKDGQVGGVNAVGGVHSKFVVWEDVGSDTLSLSQRIYARERSTAAGNPPLPPAWVRYKASQRKSLEAQVAAVKGDPRFAATRKAAGVVDDDTFGAAMGKLEAYWWKIHQGQSTLKASGQKLHDKLNEYMISDADEDIIVGTLRPHVGKDLAGTPEVKVVVGIMESFGKFKVEDLYRYVDSRYKTRAETGRILQGAGYALPPVTGQKVAPGDAKGREAYLKELGHQMAKTAWSAIGRGILAPTGTKLYDTLRYLEIAERMAKAGQLGQTPRSSARPGFAKQAPADKLTVLIAMKEHPVQRVLQHCDKSPTNFPLAKILKAQDKDFVADLNRWIGKYPIN
ncbi:MAG: hypothetical protein CSA66_01205 [Proteobacteria bacterium]|nr:MAG: hypothetical protein CSA66_01205 [Pseudomonadota bacterium]